MDLENLDLEPAKFERDDLADHLEVLGFVGAVGLWLIVGAVVALHYDGAVQFQLHALDPQVAALLDGVAPPAMRYVCWGKRISWAACWTHLPTHRLPKSSQAKVESARRGCFIYFDFAISDLYILQHIALPLQSTQNASGTQGWQPVAMWLS